MKELPRLTLFGKPLTYVASLPGDVKEITFRPFREEIKITLGASSPPVALGDRITLSSGEHSQLRGTVVEINGNVCVIMPDDRAIEESP